MSAKPVLLLATSSANLGDTTSQIELAKACQAKFEPLFLCYGFKYRHLITEAGFRTISLPPYKRSRTAPLPEKFLRQIKDEMALYERYRPVAIVNKHELGPAFSARAAQIPLIWMLPYAWTKHCFLSGVIGNEPLKVASHWFQNGSIPSEASYLHPFQEVARALKLPPPEHFYDLFEGDLTLISESPEWLGISNPPDNYRFIGPMMARLAIEIPDEIKRLDKNRPIIYFAMGSSGDPALIQKMLSDFARRPDWQIVAPVKNYIEGSVFKPPPNVILCDWLPALAVNSLADVAVTHGGLGTLSTALLSGKPMVSVGLFPEQEFNVACMERWGNGLALTPEKIYAGKLVATIEAVLSAAHFHERARYSQQLFSSINGPQNGAEAIAEFLLHADNIFEESRPQVTLVS